MVSEKRDSRARLHWHVRMLGGFQARSGSDHIDRFSSRHVLMLFARLVIEPRAAHSRAALAAWLWPDPELEPAVAKRKLATALWDLRTALKAHLAPPGAEPITRQAGTLRINLSSIRSDVADFEAAVRAGDVRTAQQLYAGALLPGLEDEWIEDQRRRLAVLFDDLQGDHGESDPAGRRGPPALLSGGPVASGARPVALLGYVDGLFGRDDELRLVGQAVRSHRLVSVLGGPGVGKTRLANEVAAAAKGFESACFVPLRACSDAAEIVEHMAAVLALYGGETPTLDRVCQALAGRRALVVLDNMEQLVGDAGRCVVASLLERLPHLHLLVTSRHALGVPDEQGFRLDGLPVPPEGAALAELGANAAVRLFVARARTARADFSLHAKNAAGIAALCRRFSGLPLAIEIAATRAKAARGDLAALAEARSMLGARVDRRARRGDRSTLADAIGASWALLDPPEQWMLVCLASFRGDCTFASVAAIAGVPADRCAGLVDGLLSHSLATAVALSGQPQGVRIRVETSVRAFAVSKAGDDDLALIRQRHRVWALNAAQAAAAQRTMIAADDWPDVNDALVAAIDAADTAASMPLALALRWHWMTRGAPRSTVLALQRLADRLAHHHPERASLFCLLARLRMRLGETDLARHAAQAAVQSSGGGGPQLADALHALTSVGLLSGGATTALLQSARDAEGAAATGPVELRANTAVLVASILSELASGPADDRLLEEAEARLQQASEAFEAIGDDRGVMSVLPAQIACLWRRKKHALVVDRALAGIARARRLGHVEAELQLLNRLALGFEGLRRWRQVLKINGELLVRAHQNTMLHHMALALWNQIEPRVRLRRHEDAALTMGFVVSFWDAHFDPLKQDDRLFIADMRSRVEQAIGPQQTLAAWRKGETLDITQVLLLGGR